MIVLTDEQITKVETLAPYLTQAQIADALGIGTTTFEDILRRQPAVREAYKKGRAEVITQIAASLVGRALAGDLTAQIFFLKTQGRWRENDPVETAKTERPVFKVVRHPEADKPKVDGNE